MAASTSSITISDRVSALRPSSTLAVNARVKELQAQGVDVIGFGAGEPDFATPEPISDAAVAALRAGKTHYAPVPGTPAAREAIAAKLRHENGIDAQASDIVISVGGKHSLYLAMQCLLDVGKGQEVVVPTPAWVSYRPQIELAGGTVIEVPGSISNDFKITAEQLEDAISERTVALVLNSPSNPCGTMYSEAELRDLASVIERHPGIVVISDEIYEKLIYTDTHHFSIGSVDAIADRVVTVNGLSKAYAMTGWRIGYAAAPGGLAKAMSKLQGQMTSGITTFLFDAVVDAITNRDDEVERMRRTFAQRGELMYTRVNAIDGLACPKPTGAFYVFPSIDSLIGRTSPAGATIEDALTFATALLEEARVAVVPGGDFGDCAANNIRLSFACSEEHISAGLDRIESWVAQLS